MPKINVSQRDFLNDRQGRTFADVAHEPNTTFGEVLRFFGDPDRQRRMEESELHHDRAPLAGVVRELEALPAIEQVFRTASPARSKRLRQAIGVIVRMIMEARGWKKTGRKGSLGVRSATATMANPHNTGGLALFFLRAERYERIAGMPFGSVRRRSWELNSSFKSSPSATPQPRNGRQRSK